MIREKDGKLEFRGDWSLIVINNSAIQISKIQEQALHQELRLDPPIETALIDLDPISFVKSRNQWNIDWLSASPGHPTPLAAAKLIMKNFVDASHAEVERYPNSPRAHTNYGLALLKEGLFNEASNQFEEALKLNPNLYIALVNLARTKIRLGRLEEAVSLYERAREQRTDDTIPDIGVAQVAIRQGNYRRAIDLLQRAVMQRDDALPRFQMGIALLGLGDKNNALAQFRTAARLQVRSPFLHVSLGAAYVMLGDYSRATRSFRTALSLSPRMVNAIHGLAIALLDKNDFERAFRLLGDHLKNQPNDSRAREILAQGFMSQCHFNEAYNHLFKAFETVRLNQPETRPVLCRLTNNLGVCDCYRSNTERAEMWYKKSIEFSDFLSADDVIPFHNLVKLFTNSDRIIEAREFLSKCEEHFPNDPNNDMISATIFMRESRNNDAREVLSSLIQRSDAPVEAFSILGYLYSDGQPDPDFDNALSVLERGHAKDPAHIPTINNLAYVLLQLGDTYRAENLLKFISPEKIFKDVFLTATTGLLWLAKGEIEKGRDLYMRAEQLSREEGHRELAFTVRQKMHLELAKAYLRLNNTSNAKMEVNEGLLIIKGRDGYRRQLENLDRSTKSN